MDLIDSTAGPLESSQLDDLVVVADRLIQIGRFVPTFAHDLNNCLQAISGLTELASEDPTLTPKVADKLRRIAAQVDRGSGAIRLLLGFARERVTTTQRVDLGAIADTVAGLRKEAIGRLRAELKVERTSAQPLDVVGSPRDFEQMVLALVLNAEDALRSSPATAPARRLHITLDADASSVSVTVTDTGVGVAEDVRQRLFEPFVTGLADHPGLGLAAARIIAQRAGGTISVESEREGEGRRTAFVVRLPKG